jgi:hypothetical protein
VTVAKIVFSTCVVANPMHLSPTANRRHTYTGYNRWCYFQSANSAMLSGRSRIIGEERSTPEMSRL